MTATEWLAWVLEQVDQANATRKNEDGSPKWPDSGYCAGWIDATAYISGLVKTAIEIHEREGVDK